MGIQNTKMWLVQSVFPRIKPLSKRLEMSGGKGHTEPQSGGKGRKTLIRWREGASGRARACFPRVRDQTAMVSCAVKREFNSTGGHYVLPVHTHSLKREDCGPGFRLVSLNTYRLVVHPMRSLVRWPSGTRFAHFATRVKSLCATDVWGR
eukprot:5839271-Amphidinium_carterae.1